jgi:hypothetical protein
MRNEYVPFEFVSHNFLLFDKQSFSIAQSVYIILGKWQWLLFQRTSLAFIEPPNKTCSRLAGFCAVFEHFSGFGFFLLSKRIHARPPAANANRWALVSEKP